MFKFRKKDDICISHFIKNPSDYFLKYCKTSGLSQASSEIYRNSDEQAEKSHSTIFGK
jgi:hypothetical protein